MAPDGQIIMYGMFGVECLLVEIIDGENYVGSPHLDQIANIPYIEMS